MLRTIAIAIYLLGTSCVLAGERARVAAADLVATAQTALQARAIENGVEAQFIVAGRIADLQLPIEGEPVLQALIPARWLRPRIGVPVQVRVGDRKLSTVTVWFAVTAPAQRLVFATDAPKGTLDSQVSTRIGAVDLARLHNAAPASHADIVGKRLVRAVTAGQPLQASDFEPVPMVSAQQAVRIEAVSGAVRLTTSGRALSDGDAGQTISVLPANAPHPVRARVVSKQVVTIER